MCASELTAVRSRNPALPLKVWKARKSVWMPSASWTVPFSRASAPLLDVLELLAGVADEFLDQLGVEVGLEFQRNLADLFLGGAAHGGYLPAVGTAAASAGNSA